MSGQVALAPPQPKVAPRPVSRPHDSDEREAEHVAEVVAAGGSVAGWSFAGAASPPTPPDELPVHRCASPGACLCDACGARVEQVLGEPGGSLDSSARRYMEAGFGYDFGRVRLHSDSGAAASARGLGASAYTVGDHIVTAGGPPTLSNASGRRLLAHELAHVVQHERSGNSTVVHRQAAPAPATTPASREPQRMENVGRGGSRVDAVYDRANSFLTVQVKILFDWTRPIPAAWTESRRNAWRDSFIRTVTHRWSFKHFLVPQQPCSTEPPQVAVRFQVIPVTSSPHFTMHITYSETQSSVTENRDASGRVTSREADLDVFDDARRSDQPQVPAEHEFGHMLGLPHIRCDDNRDECYGVTREEKADVLGRGSFVSPRDYEPFAELMVPPLTTCTWRVSPRSVVPTSRGPLIGGFLGGLLGGAAGALLGSIAGPIGAIVGGLIGLGGGIALGAYLGTPEVPS